MKHNIFLEICTGSQVLFATFFESIRIRVG